MFASSPAEKKLEIDSSKKAKEKSTVLNLRNILFKRRKSILIDLDDINVNLDDDLPADYARIEWSKTNDFRIYLILTLLITLSEPFLLGFLITSNNAVWTFVSDHGGTNGPYITQIILIALSWIGLLYSILRPMKYLKRDDCHKFPELKEKCTMRLSAMLDAPVYFEFFCLLVGSVFLPFSPGIASIRILRPFRLLWYGKLFSAKGSGGKERTMFFFLDPFRSIHLCILYLERVMQEILYNKGRGGILVIFIFLYITYVFAVAFNIEQSALVTPEGTPCASLSTCYLTFLRLSFYDGNGFDFLASLAQANTFHTILVFSYMIFTAMILLNGLISIFGHSFDSQVEIEQAEVEELEARARKKEILTRKRKLQEAKENERKRGVRAAIPKQQQQMQVISPLQQKPPEVPPNDDDDDNESDSFEQILVEALEKILNSLEELKKDFKK